MHPAVSNGGYDVARIREDFPILSMQVYGKPLIYLDNAASAQKPKAVLDRLQHAYTAEYANVHRGLHYLANAATEAYEDARAKVAAFLNAARHNLSAARGESLCDRAADSRRARDQSYTSCKVFHRSRHLSSQHSR